MEEFHGLDVSFRRGLAAARLVSVRAWASYWGNKVIDTTSQWVVRTQKDEGFKRAARARLARR